MSNSTPSWECLRANRWMVVDHATLQFAIYPTAAGSVALIYQQQDAGSPSTVTLCPDEISLLCKQLELAQRYAQKQQEISMEFAAAQQTFDVLARLRKGAG